VAQVVPNVKRSTLIPFMAKKVSLKSVLYTDDLPSYNKLDSMGFDHKTVPHSQKIYVTAGDIHTNSVEGFWSQLKRSINGTYHHVMPEHLQEYADEYSFRYSHRKDEKPMFISMLEQVVEHTSEKALLK